jgi:3-oxoacyl-[acyl-carrier-protein] synthase III
MCWQEEPVSPCAWATMTSQMSANAGGGYENVLVIGADALSRYVDWMDRGTCILFGDAAGALVLQVCSVLPLFL